MTEDPKQLLDAVSDNASRVRELVRPGATDFLMVALGIQLGTLVDPDTYKNHGGLALTVLFTALFAQDIWLRSRLQRGFGAQIPRATWIAGAVTLAGSLIAHTALRGDTHHGLLGPTLGILLLGTIFGLAAIHRNLLLVVVAVIGVMAALGEVLNVPKVVMIVLLIALGCVAAWVGRKQLFRR